MRKKKERKKERTKSDISFLPSQGGSFKYMYVVLVVGFMADCLTKDLGQWVDALLGGLSKGS